VNSAAELWFDWSLDTWPVFMAVLVALSTSLLGGVFLLRRAALLGDAVSHSVLPGIAAGLLLSGLVHPTGGEEAFGVSRNMLYVLGGALVAGILSTTMIEALSRYSRIKPDTALGAVFPAFFAVGVILIEVAASGAHLDADCVFYGSLELIAEFHQTVPTLVATVFVAVFLLVALKEILLSSFDPGLARTLGLRVRLVDNALIVLLTATVVCAFEAVGAILVIAFLIIPPATAYLLADRFHRVLLLSALLGVTSAVLGCWLTILLGSAGFETARAPSMAVVAGLLFLLVFLLAPERGVLARYRRQRALSRRILDENLLGAIYRLHPTQTAGASADPVAVSLDQTADILRYPLPELRHSLARGVKRGEVVDHGDGRVSLTAEGTSRIERILRAHRLWESYMIQELGARPDHVHDTADVIEHYLQPSLVEELDSTLRRPTKDPHGKEIPK